MIVTKRKIKTFFAVLLTSTVIALPVTSNAGYHTSYTSWMCWYQQMTQKWFHQFKVPDVPTNVTAIYKHQGTYSSLKDHLEVNWDDCKNAERYEVRVVNKDGTEHIYKTTSSILYVYDIECNSGGSVQIRSVNGFTRSSWSDSVKIGDNKIH